MLYLGEIYKRFESYSALLSIWPTLTESDFKIELT